MQLDSTSREATVQDARATRFYQYNMSGHNESKLRDNSQVYLSSILLAARSSGTYSVFCSLLQSYQTLKSSGSDTKRILETLLRSHKQLIYQSFRTLHAQRNTTSPFSQPEKPSRPPGTKHANQVTAGRVSRQHYFSKLGQLEYFIRNRLRMLKLQGESLSVLQSALHDYVRKIIASTAQVAERRHRHTSNNGLRPLFVPKRAVRQINSSLQKAHKIRVEQERQALLLVGENLAKRGRGARDEDVGLQEKLSKVLREEEDRAVATATNEAVRSALGGDAKYLRWAQMQQGQPTKPLTVLSYDNAEVGDNPADNAQEPEYAVESVNLYDLRVALDLERKSKSRHLQHLMHTKL